MDRRGIIPMPPMGPMLYRPRGDDEIAVRVVLIMHYPHCCKPHRGARAAQSIGENRIGGLLGGSSSAPYLNHSACQLD